MYFWSSTQSSSAKIEKLERFSDLFQPVYFHTSIILYQCAHTLRWLEKKYGLQEGCSWSDCWSTVTQKAPHSSFSIYTGYEHASRWPVPAIFLGKQIAFQICSPCTYADSEASRDDLSIWTVLWQLRLCSQLCHLPGLTIVWDFDWRLIAEVEVNLASSSQYANFKLDGSDREEPERSSSSFYFHPV